MEAFDEAGFESTAEAAQLRLEERFESALETLNEGNYSEAAKALRPLASDGHFRAQHLLGLLYRFGMGVRQSDRIAAQWFGAATDQGYPMARLALAEHVLSGEGQPDFERARSLLEPIAASEWAYAVPLQEFGTARDARFRASYLLGTLLAEGHGGPADRPRALELLRKASHGGDAMASLHLAIEYAKGGLAPKDLDESRRYFSLVDLQSFDSVRRSFQAAMLENADPAVHRDMERSAAKMSEDYSNMVFQSQTEFAKLALQPDSPEHDPELAASLLRMAAESGYKEAQYLLGYCYAEGLGLEADASEARAWLEKASAQGWTLADYNLGSMLLVGKGGEADEERARKLLNRSADQGFFHAQLVLDGDAEADFVDDSEDLQRAEMAERRKDPRAVYAMTRRRAGGWLVDQVDNPKKLARAYRVSARSGYARAQYMYGDCYYKGFGVKQDFQAAFEWYRRGAEQNHELSIFGMGYLYESGQGTPRDFVAAKEYYDRAVAWGSSMAANNLGSLYGNGRLGEPDHVKALEYYLLAAQETNQVAYFNLGNAYQFGRGTPADARQALEWFTKSAEAGYSEAARRIADLYALPELADLSGTEAAYWMERAAELGDQSAMKEMALRYRSGNGVPISRAMAMNWASAYLAALQKEGRQARVGNLVPKLTDEPLGLLLHFNQRHDYEVALLMIDALLEADWSGHDPEQAFELATDLSEEGFFGAHFRLVALHLSGQSKRSNPKAAELLLRRILREGVADSRYDRHRSEAAYQLSQLYFRGSAVKPDAEEALRWLQVAAELGLPKARFDYALRQLEGLGMPVDADAALLALRALMREGHEPAALRLGELMAEGRDVAADREEVVGVLAAIADSGNVRASEILRTLGVERKPEHDESPPRPGPEPKENRPLNGPAAIG